jgi:ABC-type amino acid transport substrate-binding protein
MAALMLCMGGCVTTTGSDLEPAMVVNPPLRVGITPDYEPIIYKRGKEILGLEADFARELGALLKRDVECVDLDWDEQIPALENGSIDIIMSGMSITKPRSRRVLFAAPYLRTGQLLLVQAKDVHRFRHPQVIEFSEAKVGVVKGTTGDLYVQYRCPKVNRVSYTSAERGVKALAKGNIEAFIHDAPSAWTLAAQYEAEGLVVMSAPLTEEHLAWAVNKRNRTLLAEVNAAREQMIESGRLSQLLQQWLP